MFTKILTKLGFTKEETSWILYDVGNSAQVLTTCTVIFPLLIAKITPGDSSVYVGWANAIYAIILALISPVLGTMADYKDKKMRMFKFFLYMGIFGGFALALPFIDYKMALLVFVIAMLGYNGSIIFYDAFIVDVCDDERVDKVSAAGYAWGYIGSVLPFLIFVIPFAAVTLFGDKVTGDLVIGSFTLTYRMACGITMGLAVLWWWIYSRPMLKNVKQKNYHEPVPHVIKESFAHLWHTFRDVKKNKNIFLFCISYFFYIDCVNTVIKMAVSLATEMGITDTMSLVVVIFINIIACPFSILFGKLVGNFGSKKMIYAGIIGYIGVVGCGAMIQSNPSFIWLVALLVGMFQGGIQSVSRSYFAKLIPDKADSNEFFGFFSVFSNFSAILGPIAVSIIIMITGETRYGILGLIPMMVLGMIFLMFVKDPESEQKFRKKKKV
ncbi:MAG: MFS transporter [Longicatena caecimuris]|uniref:MFS transporter n=1 Tax=Longicatena caecimuris TaxID=1796635 RepID=UPI00399B9310